MRRALTMEEAVAQAMPLTSKIRPRLVSPNSDQPAAQISGPSVSVPAGLIVRRMSDVQAKAIDWLWLRRLPLGMLSLIAGRQGLGKSTVAAAIMAHVTTGKPWPDLPAVKIPVGRAILLAAEDAAEYIIRPRLEVAGADLSRVHLIEGVSDGADGSRPLRLDCDIDLARQLIAELRDVRLLVIDPLDGYFPDGVNLNAAGEVRPALQRLAALAEGTGVAVLGIKHLRKGAADEAVYRISGSGAFTEVPRAVHALTDSDDDPDLLHLGRIKGNVSRKPPDLCLRIEDVAVANLGPVGKVRWIEGAPDTSVEDRLSERSRGREAGDGPKVREAKSWLTIKLDGGTRLARELYAEAFADTISDKTLDRAADALRVKRTNGGVIGAPWTWRLPDEA